MLQTFLIKNLSQGILQNETLTIFLIEFIIILIIPSNLSVYFSFYY